MLSTIKKFTAISILILVLLSGLAGASNVFNFKSLNYDSASTKTITLYRYGPDGTVNSMQINIDPKDGKNLEDVIAEKCREMMGNDAVIQSYLSGNNSNTTINAFSRVTSHGKGTHLKSPFSIRIPFLFLLKYGLLQKLPLRYRILGPRWIPLVIGNYSQDESAETDIKTVPTPIRPDATQITVEGKHIVLIYGFVGYTGWRGTSADFYEKKGWATGFDGYGSFIFCAKFP
jgi:hypothetical protein